MAKWGRIAVTVLVLSSVVTAAPPSGLAQDAEAPPAEAEVSRRWYGWQVLLAGLGIPVTFVVALAADATTGAQPLGSALLIGSALSPFAPAVVHALHGHAGRAATSLAFDVGAPLAVGLVFEAMAAADEQGSFELGFPGYLIVTFALMAPVAIVLDAITLSWDETVVEAGASARLQPSLQVGPDQATVGIGGVF